MERYFSCAAADTLQQGYQLGKSLLPNALICLFGDLGAGKTTFIKGLVQGAAQVDAAVVQSPTFTYLNIYEGIQTIYHFDLYRLKDINEFLSMGFDEYFEAGGICCIEWSERLGSYLPLNSLQVHLTHAGEDQRWITMTQGKQKEEDGAC
jgi:tRNA threonylcarbamoyladenosine biosynthesis protein TsaE